VHEYYRVIKRENFKRKRDEAMVADTPIRVDRLSENSNETDLPRSIDTKEQQPKHCDVQ
jgi:hypothetical protein